MDTDTDEEMEMDEPLVFEVSEIDSDYEFDATRWFDFTKEESPLDSRLAQLWFETAQSHPPSPFAIKLMRDEAYDNKTEPSLISEHGEASPIFRESVDREISLQPQDVARDLKEPVDGMKSGVFNFTHGGSLKKAPNQSLHKGPIGNHVRTADKVKCQPKSSTRPIPRSSTLMKPTASQLAKMDNARAHMQVDETKEKGLFPSSASETQASKRQKLDGGRLRKVAQTTHEMNFVHKALKKDRILDRSSHHAKAKLTVPQEPAFATAHRANRTRNKDDAKLDQDSTAVHRFKARPLNRKIFDAPSLPIRKKSTPKPPEFQEFHLKTSERAMQHSSAVSTSSYQGNNNHHKGSDKPDTTSFLDGVNREPRRTRDTDIHKDDDDRKHIFIRPLNNKVLPSRRDTGISRKSKQETTAALDFSFHSEKKTQPNLPTELFSKLSIKSELQPDNGSRLRLPQPELVKGSKENRLNSFQAGNERTSKFLGKPMVQCGLVPETSRQWNGRR